MIQLIILEAIMAKRKTGDSIHYSNRKKLNTDFSSKDLKRSNCFNTNFTGSTFKETNLKGSQFKNCNFKDTTFTETEIIASNFKNSRFHNTSFDHVVFDTVNLEGTDFSGASFNQVIFIHTDVSKAVNLDMSSEGIKWYQDEPVLEISDRLKRAIKASKKNEFIKKSGVLDSKTGDINTLSVILLLEEFNEESLIIALAKVKNELNKDFFTLSQFITKLKTI